MMTRARLGWPVHPRAGGERSGSPPSATRCDGSSPRGRGTQVVSVSRVVALRFIPARAGNAGAFFFPATERTVHPRAGGERSSTWRLYVSGIGSSPRGRGTLDAEVGPARAGRFIPARAGNASERSRNPSSTTVHPRAGGERCRCVCDTQTKSGSSPRGRGTPHTRPTATARQRFIPARAGNAYPTRDLHPPSTVHPRAGGERLRDHHEQIHVAGSSPRGRGTRGRKAACNPFFRFIPARAGNAPSARRRRIASPVHPRAGGERDLRPRLVELLAGSSPRGRGTLDHLLVEGVGLRFIPARAGNACAPALGEPRSTVHPRAGGERLSQSVRSWPPYGSSPRGRGTPPAQGFGAGDGRFIPARAGNAGLPEPCRSLVAVHPRAGGERELSGHRVDPLQGSSPRGRGTRPGGVVACACPRFIPARAGNAPHQRLSSSRPTVHPRAGGERPERYQRLSGRHGSSPRGRGTQPVLDQQLEVRWFIPARAGNATSRRITKWATPVHPRAGGERRGLRRRAGRAAGSSPRGRGTQRHRVRLHADVRFIPARAGNAAAAVGN